MKFKYNYSKYKIEFLDTLICIDHNKHLQKMFCKN